MKHLSKYAEYQSTFHRRDPWKYHNIPYDFEIKRSKLETAKEIAIFAACIALLAFVYQLAGA